MTACTITRAPLHQETRILFILNYLFNFIYGIQPEGVVIFFLLLGCTTSSIV